MSLAPIQPVETVADARYNALVAAVNHVSALSGAFPIEVRRDASGVQIALAREPKAWLFVVEAFEAPAPRTSDGVAYYPGRRLRLNASDEYAGDEPDGVTLYDPLARDEVSRELKPGDWLLARFNADDGRWEIVRGPLEAGRVARFRTTGTLALGGSASALLRNWDSDTSAYVDGAAITVQDFSSPGRWQAYNGAEGVCARLPDKSEYEILWVEHPAIFATATLTGEMEAGSAPATFTDHWQGPGGVGAPTHVFDVDGRYAHLVADDKVLCCWDDIEAKYKICDGPQAGQKIRWAYATADWINGPLNTSHVVCEEATGKDGASAGGGTFNVYLPRASGSQDPNVRQGMIVGYLFDEEGNRVAVTGYLDDCLGTIKIWSGATTGIPAGWQLCNGANGTPDLREKFVLGAFGDAGGIGNFDGQGNGTTVGSSGGRRFTLPFPIIYETLVTEPTNLDIGASPGQTIPTSETSLSLSGTITADGHTQAAKADIYVIDPLRVQEVVSSFAEATQHEQHGHLAVGEEVEPSAGSTGVYGLTSLCVPAPTIHECGPAMELAHIALEPGQEYVGGPGAGQTVTHPVGDADPDTPGVQEGHRHEITDLVLDTEGASIDPNPHDHYTYAIDIAEALTIDPDPHYHLLNLPIKNVPGQNVVNPYFALCYIQRVN